MATPQSSKTVLLTAGRSPVSLDLARQFKAAGYRVVLVESEYFNMARVSRAVDQFQLVPSPALDSERYVAAVLNVIEQERVTLLIPIYEELFYLAVRRRELEARCQVLLPDIKWVARLHNKWEFNRLLHEFGIPAPLTWLARSQAELEKHVRENAPVFVKAAYSRFAFNIESFRSPGDRIPVREISMKNPLLIQKWIEGNELCTWSVAREGRLLAHVTYRHAFTVGKGAGVCFEAVDHPAIHEWVRNFVGRIGYTGQIAFDFIEDRDQRLFPLECNPRSTSGAHLFSGKTRLDQVFAGTTTGCVVPEPGTRVKLAVGMCLYGIRGVRSLSQLRCWISMMMTGREPVFAWHDPCPFFYQLYCFLVIALRARRAGKATMEAAVEDIQWDGGTRPELGD